MVRQWDLKPARAMALGRKLYKRGTLARIIKNSDTTEALVKSKAEYELNKLAPGSRQAQADRVMFWTRRAAAHGIEAFPIDPDKLKLLGSLLYAGAYRSAAACVSAVKMEHIRRGGSWTAHMAKEVTDGIRSCTRGQGPDKQSAELDLDDVAKLNGVMKHRHPGWPAAGPDVVLAMGCWLLREVEGGTARLGDVSLVLGEGCGRAIWQLPCSKMDVRALGHSRTHGCSCPDVACPTAAMRRIVGIAQAHADAFVPGQRR